jgi:uncharacterized membrane protein YphA (DoxX/SURF4 family)
MNNNIFIGSICILVLYIYSGYEKILDLNKTAESLHSKLNILPMNLCIIAIIGVIILELFGSLFIIYSVYNNTNKKEVYYTIIAFILFNIMATLLYHYPNNHKQLMNFLKNLSITGGFVFLLELYK